MSNVDPDFLAELDSEAEYARKGNRPDRLQLDKGTGAVVRFLPVQMGTRRTWFGRIGRHWHNKKPIGCPRATSPSMGGAMDADCPVCALAESLMVDHDEAIQKIGKSLSVWPKYLTYVLVLEWVDSKGDHEPVKQRDLYTPQALWLPRTAFTELERLIKKSLVTAPGLGLVDPVLGNDVEVRLDARNNWRFDLLAQQPLRGDLDEEALVSWTDALCRDIKVDDTTPAPYDKLEEYAAHVEKQLSDVPPPPRRGRYEEGAGESAPPRRAAAPARALAPPRALPRAPAPAPQSAVETELDAVVDDGEAPPPPPPQRRAAVAPLARPVARPTAPATPGRAAIAPPPARRVATPPPESSPDDEVAPESRDAAPPISDAEDTDAPPPVPASAPRAAAPRRTVSAALRSTLSKGI